MTVLRSDHTCFGIKIYAAIAAIAAFAGCSVIVDSDASKLGALPLACETGRKMACPCTDGTTGTQVCNKFARYDPCTCGGARAGAPAAGTAGAGH